MLREEKMRILGEVRDFMDKIDNLVDKSKTVKMLREGKMRIVDPIGKERETEKRQKRIGDERQRITKILKKFNDVREAEVRKIKSVSMRDLLRFVKFLEKTIPKYINFLVKNGFLLDKYLVKCPDVFPVSVQPQKNEKDTAQWFNLEDVKSKEDLKACGNFVKEWKRYFYSYRKLMWGEKTGRKMIYEKMWSEIRQYYYMQLMPKKKLDKICGVSYERAKAKRYELIAERFNKKYGPLLPGKHPSVPQEDAFWRKFYGIKDEYRKAHCNKN